MDALVLGDFLLQKDDQPAWPEGKGHVEQAEGSGAADLSDPFIRKLARIFDREFLPIVRGLKSRNALEIDTAFARVPSTWSDYKGPQSPREIFVIPEELEGEKLDPVVAAEAISRYWLKGDATEQLRSVLVKLLRLGLRYPLSESLEEEIEDSVYVMF